MDTPYGKASQPMLASQVYNKTISLHFSLQESLVQEEELCGFSVTCQAALCLNEF